jgi:hypothetical protein
MICFSSLSNMTYARPLVKEDNLSFASLILRSHQNKRHSLSGAWLTKREFQRLAVSTFKRPRELTFRLTQLRQGPGHGTLRTSLMLVRRVSGLPLTFVTYILYAITSTRPSTFLSSNVTVESYESKCADGRTTLCRP